MSKTKMNFFLRWFPAIAYAAFIFSMSQSSHPPGASLAPDYVGHSGEYALFTITVLWGTTAGLRLLDGWRWVLAWGIVAVYAASDEFHQAFVPLRDPSFFDLTVDIIAGTLVTLSVAWLLKRVRRSRA